MLKSLQLVTTLPEYTTLLTADHFPVPKKDGSLVDCILK